MSALSIASTGLTAATARFEASAQRTAVGAADLATEAVEQVSTRQEFSANLTMMRTADRMSEQLLDILV